MTTCARLVLIALMTSLAAPAYAASTDSVPNFSALDLAFLFPSNRLTLTQAKASSPTVEQGKSVTFTVTYKAPSALSGVLVDLELRSQKTFAKIGQQTYAKQAFAKGETRSFTLTVPIGAKQALGKYSLVAVTLDNSLRGISVNLNAAQVSVVAPQPTTPPPAIAQVIPSFYGVTLAGGELPGVYGEDWIYPQASDLDYFNSKGLKTIRLLILWERLQPTLNGPLDDVEVQRVRDVTALAAARGMGIVLLPYNFAAYNNQPIGNPEVPASAYADFMQKLASAFRDDAGVYAYDLMEMPEGAFSGWPAIAQGAINAIRSADNAKLILAQGECGSHADTFATCNPNLKLTDSSNNMAIEARQFFSPDGTANYSQSYDVQQGYPEMGVDRLKSFVQYLGVTNQRGFLGEYGIPGDDPRWVPVLSNAFQYLQSNCVPGADWLAGVTTANQRLSVQPINGADKPQMPTLQANTTAPNCKNF